MVNHLQDQYHGKKASTRQLLVLCLGLAIGCCISTLLCSRSLSIATTPTSKDFSNSADHNSANYLSDHKASAHGYVPVLQEQKRVATPQHRQARNNKSTNTTSRHHHFHHIENSNMSEISPRAWPYWPSETPLPCFHAPNKTKEEGSKVYRKRGLLFLKPLKVGSSTAMGVNLRIAEHEAQRQNKTFGRCTATHGHAKGYYFQDRIPNESVLWSMMRDPTKRIVSEFFHFIVSREKVEPTLRNFVQHIRNTKLNSRNYNVAVHNPTGYGSGSGTASHIVNRIMNAYDFIGITERFDESMVVLQLLLHLPTSDVLYLNAKRAGSYDDGGYKNICYYIVPSFVTPGMAEYFESNEWKSHVEKDYVLYHAVNASLDQTIDHAIGREKFDAALRKFRYAQQIVNDECADEAKFPCTPDGVKVGEQATDCYHKDSGCCKSCINRVVEERGLY
jgi:hypothetical protein